MEEMLTQVQNDKVSALLEHSLMICLVHWITNSLNRLNHYSKYYQQDYTWGGGFDFKKQVNE
jgi:hypothetical protein